MDRALDPGASGARALTPGYSASRNRKPKQGHSVRGSSPAGQDPVHSLSPQLLALHLRPIKRRGKTADRSWHRRSKVSLCISKDFPWEVILKHLEQRPQSLILMQMVDKNLNQVLRTSHDLWKRVYTRHFHYKAYMARRVDDPLFPGLKLWKNGLTGVPYHTGPLPAEGVPGSRAEGEALSFTPAFRDSFTSYARRWLALLHGRRCGMCGCRFRHEVYWSLRMRLCKLCVAQNCVSSWELHTAYGLDYATVLRNVAGKVFYFNTVLQQGEDRVAFHAAKPSDLREKRSQLMFWRPHMQRLYDLPSLRVLQTEKRRQALFLCSVVRRRWMRSLRVLFAGKHALKAIDCLLSTAYRNEKKRIMTPYGKAVPKGGPDWAFPELPLCGHTRHFTLTGETQQAMSRRLYAFEDHCVAN